MSALDTPTQSGLGSLAAAKAPHKATSSPIVTGSSVLALKYRDGVMMAADTLGSYGSMAKFTDLRRLRAVGKSTLIGASGEYSDFQHIMDLLSEIVRVLPGPPPAPASPRSKERGPSSRVWRAPPPALTPPPTPLFTPCRLVRRLCWTTRPA